MKKYASYKEDFEQKKRRKMFSRATRLVILGCLLAGGGIYGLFFANIFDVREIEVISSGSIPDEEIRMRANEILDSQRLGITRRRNSLLFSTQALRPALLESFARIDSLEIRRTTLHKLTITIVERVPVGLWCFPSRQTCFYYDVEGTAFAEILPSSGFLYVPVNDYRSREIRLGERVASDEWRNNISEVKKILQFGDISTSEVIIPADSYDEFYVVTREGWRILLSHEAGVRKQTNSLLVFLKEKITPEERKTLDYIDLRIEDRIYYKQK